MITNWKIKREIKKHRNQNLFIFTVITNIFKSQIIYYKFI